ncbi:SDR family NAD(P)-dependent oxidoreductase [Bradyrhizobium canariense]|uniref:SDR family NAD(P)-dependent oxidoreductase n=1 Tax=Bradyrhizobium canariense TaxID=255045 RepID=UPI000A18CA59|nr:SDR family NAD(P)-dependent oxidoreductase [Bradyrhizobium canariense]OSI23753.1 hypothetical protein BST65_20840 [Bradyrhizobium canariense]OSI30990.1 hypothetical protein BST66_21005 [Bradyrhizobium canariense]OSI39895.1 hypothetical protein BSZ20_28555 [Bradyrhizobium canariense]OSI48185.1 hypothetical protein BST67_19035 [Bradyrhizobium canariense]OSI50070.1 hypothetical protein BSZ15_33890 [Bradyrhizobium canariense]
MPEPCLTPKARAPWPARRSGPLRGHRARAAAEAMDDKTFSDVLDINLKGAFYTCRAAGEVLIAHGHGAIVTIASITAKGASPATRALHVRVHVHTGRR